MKTLNIKSLLQLPQENPILSWTNRRWDWSLFWCENLISQSSHWNNFSPWKALMCVSSLDLDGYVFGFEHRVHMKHMWWSRSSGLVKHLKQSRHSNLAIFDELYSTGIKSFEFLRIFFVMGTLKSVCLRHFTSYHVITLNTHSWMFLMFFNAIN